MPDERTQPPHNQTSQIPDKYSWPSLLKKDGNDLFDHFRRLVEELGKRSNAKADLHQDKEEKRCSVIY